MAFPGDDIQTESFLLCRAGRHLCAITMSRVVETMRILPIEKLSGTPGFVRGMSVIRGAPVPVIDLPDLLNIGETRPQRLVTIDINGRIVALLVDSVLGIRPIAAAAISALPPLLREAAGETVSAIGILDTELLLFLNDMRVISESAISASQAAEAAS